jgi:hypothetical protein
MFLDEDDPSGSVIDLRRRPPPGAIAATRVTRDERSAINLLRRFYHALASSFHKPASLTAEALEARNLHAVE